VTIERTPLFFGPEERSLFGWYHAPDNGAAGDLAMVVCPPPGHEGVNAHRPLRHLTDALAKAGVPALRFDYHGTGDSAGRDEDPARVAAWRESISVAMTTLRTLSGCTRIGLIGLRLGALLAAAVAAEQEVDCLVLWFPPARGRTWVREMRALHLTGVTRDAKADGGAIEPGGFVFTEETQRDLNAINLDMLVPKTKRLLLLTRDDLSTDTVLCDRWRAADIDAEQRAAPGATEMFLPPHSVVVPVRAIEEIVGWVSADAQAPMTRGPVAPVPLRTWQVVDADGGAQVRESIVRFGDGQRTFGVLSEPAGKPAAGPAIVLSNAGSAHHVGPNRLYVLLSRALSAAGFRCLRFDLPGLGDSIIDDVERENDPYPSDATASIAAAAQVVLEGAGEVILTGLCSGAHASFHAALELESLPIVESVIVNPLTFYYERGMSLEQSPVQHYEEWQRYTESIRSARSWAKLVRGQVRLTAVARNVYARFRDILASRVRALRNLGRSDDEETPDARDLGRDLRRIAKRGRKLTFVFSKLDPGYDLLMFNGAADVQRLQKRGMLDLWRIAGATHTFEAARPRAVMIDSLVQHLRQRYRP
jgi:alpha/beta superfamily hydrolase